MRSWKTSLGGALAATGIFLAGAPMAMSACNVSIGDKLFAGCIIAGFFLQAAGTFVIGLFGRDNDVPSAAVPAAAAKLAEIKSDKDGILPLP